MIPIEVDYRFTRVTHNTIVTAGNFLKIGVGQGSSVWWTPSKRQVNRGAIVSHNLITRNLAHISKANPSTLEVQLGEGSIGYGFPVGSDIAEWTCVDNISEDNVIYSGDISSTLPGFLNASPGPFVRDAYGEADGDEADEASLRLQPEFIQGKIRGILNVQPGPSKVLAFNGGEFKLSRGESRHLSTVDIIFTPDAELSVLQLDPSDGGGTWVWTAGIRERIDPRHPDLTNAQLYLAPSGKLLVADSQNPDSVLVDLTPHVSWQPLIPAKRPNAPRLVLSANTPYISVSSHDGNLLYASSYFVPRLHEFPVGRYVARPTPHIPGGGALVYTLSPQRQFVVAYAKAGIPHVLEWPVKDPENYQVVASIGDGQTEGVNDWKARMVLQGDGHLV
jgi:hypothetical protein